MRCLWFLLLVTTVTAFADDLVRTDARSVIYIRHSDERIVLPEGQYLSWMSSDSFENEPDTVVTFVQIYRRPAAYWSTVRAVHFMDSMRASTHSPPDTSREMTNIEVGRKFNQESPLVDIFEAGQTENWYFGWHGVFVSSEGSFWVFPEWINCSNITDPLRGVGQLGDSTFPYLAFHFCVHFPSETLYFYLDYPVTECKLSMWFDREGEVPPPFPLTTRISALLIPTARGSDG